MIYIILMFILFIFWFFYISKRPIVLILVYIVLLPFQDFSIMLLTNLPGIPLGFWRGLMAWKEIFLILSLLQLFFSRNINLNIIDKFMIINVILCTIYLILPNDILNSSSDIITKIAGFRFSILPIALYFFGRYIYIKEVDFKKLFKFYLITSFIIMSFGIFETVLIPRDIYTNLLINFGKENLTMIKVGEDNVDSFLANLEKTNELYTREILGQSIPRLISTLMKPLAPAYYSLLISIFIVTIYSFRYYPFGQAHNKILIGTIIFGLFLTQTRAVLLALIFAVLLINTLYGKAKALPLLLTFLFIPILVFNDIIFEFLQLSFSLSDASSRGHLFAMQYGLDVVLNNPWGVGLGQGGPMGAAFGQQAAGWESLFLMIAGERGILSAFVFIVTIIVLIYHLWKRIRLVKSHSILYLVSVTILLATFGYFLTSFTTETWFGFQYGGIYWIVLGLVITQLNTPLSNFPK